MRLLPFLLSALLLTPASFAGPDDQVEEGTLGRVQEHGYARVLNASDGFPAVEQTWTIEAWIRLALEDLERCPMLIPPDAPWFRLGIACDKLRFSKISTGEGRKKAASIDLENSGRLIFLPLADPDGRSPNRIWHLDGARVRSFLQKPSDHEAWKARRNERLALQLPGVDRLNDLLGFGNLEQTQVVGSPLHQPEEDAQPDRWAPPPSFTLTPESPDFQLPVGQWVHVAFTVDAYGTAIVHEPAMGGMFNIPTASKPLGIEIRAFVNGIEHSIRWFIPQEAFGAALPPDQVWVQCKKGLSRNLYVFPEKASDYPDTEVLRCDELDKGLPPDRIRWRYHGYVRDPAWIAASAGENGVFAPVRPDTELALLEEARRPREVEQEDLDADVRKTFGIKSGWLQVFLTIGGTLGAIALGWFLLSWSRRL